MQNITLELDARSPDVASGDAREMFRFGCNVRVCAMKKRRPAQAGLRNCEFRLSRRELLELEADGKLHFASTAARPGR